LSGGRIVFLTERENVPVVVIGAVLLDMRADQLLFKAILRRTITWNCLTGELLPVIEPASAFACVLTGAIDVSNSHAFPPFGLYALTQIFSGRGFSRTTAKAWLCFFQIKGIFY
jgi:hypothetical protein